MNPAAARQLVQSLKDELSLSPTVRAIVSPCPNCSFVDMPNGRDKIVAPRIAQGPRSGLWFTLPCCRLSDGIPPQQSREDALALWNGACGDLIRLPEVARPKALHTAAQLSHQESHP